MSEEKNSLTAKDTLPDEIILQYYEELLKIKPLQLQTKYPFSAMDEEKVSKTLKSIELEYQQLKHVFVDRNAGRKKNTKRGGGIGGKILVFTM